MAHARFPWKIVAATGGVVGVLGAIALTRQGGRPASASQRVALIGDSYAVGLGPELARLFSDFRYEGHVGVGTTAWAAHAPKCGECGGWLAAFKPAIVLVALGVNDGSTPSTSSYQSIVRELHGIGARVVWIEPPASVDTPAVRGAIASLGVQTVPATTTPLAADGLHPRSYSPWAQDIMQSLGRAGLLPLQARA